MPYKMLVKTLMNLAVFLDKTMQCVVQCKVQIYSVECTVCSIQCTVSIVMLDEEIANALNRVNGHCQLELTPDNTHWSLC